MTDPNSHRGPSRRGHGPSSRRVAGLRAIFGRIAEALFVAFLLALTTYGLASSLKPPKEGDVFVASRLLSERRAAGELRPALYQHRPLDREQWLSLLVEEFLAALSKLSLRWPEAADSGSSLVAPAALSLFQNLASGSGLTEASLKAEAEAFARRTGESLPWADLSPDFAALFAARELLLHSGRAGQERLLRALQDPGRAGLRPVVAALGLARDSGAPRRNALTEWLQSAREALAAGDNRLALEAESQRPGANVSDSSREDAAARARKAVSALEAATNLAVAEVLLEAETFVPALLADRDPRMALLAWPLLVRGLAAPSLRLVLGDLRSVLAKRPEEATRLRGRIARYWRAAAPQFRAPQSGLERALAHFTESGFGLWLSDLFSGDLCARSGTSMAGLDFQEEFARRWPVSVVLGLSALGLALFFSIPAGLWIGHRGLHRMRFLWALDLLYVAPTFWVGGLLISGLRGRWPTSGLAPRGGHEGETGFFSVPLEWLESAQHFLLPAFVLALPLVPLLTRLLAREAEGLWSAPFVRFAAARGTSPVRLARAYVLPTAIIPVISLLAGSLPGILGGSLVIERLFDLPGLGEIAVLAAEHRKSDQLAGLAAYAGIFSVLGFALGDLLVLRLDARREVDQR